MSPQIPPHALLCWIDGNDLFAALPRTNGDYYITTFPLSEGGLAKALAALRPPPTRAPRPSSARSKADHVAAPTVSAPPEARASAREILRKAGIL